MYFTPKYAPIIGCQFTCARVVGDGERRGRARTAGLHAATDNAHCAGSSLVAQCVLSAVPGNQAVSVWVGVLDKQDAYDGGGKRTVTCLSA